MKPPNPHTTLFLCQVYTKFKSLPPFDTRLHRLMLDIEREQDKVHVNQRWDSELYHSWPIHL
jgi:hypothetical protein